MKINKPKYLIIHHTGGTKNNPLEDTSHHTCEMVNEYHKSLGWGKIGYHYFIEKDGKVKQGRADDEIGAHTIGYNDVSIGVCLAGNFDVTLPTPAQITALKELLTRLKYKYKISTENIVPHRKFANKSCYGKYLSDDWVKALLSPPMAPSEPCSTLKVELEEKEREVSNYKSFINSLLKLIK